jgi:carboxyl-terminal processing protease
MQGKNRVLLLPSLFTITLILGMFLGFRYYDELAAVVLKSKSGNLQQVLRLIEKKYVDSVDFQSLQVETIDDLLSKLDPHSVFIPASDVADANETLEGSFDGIGVEFYLLRDTIYVVSAIPGGPAESLGILSGDKIVSIEGKKVAGIKIKNADVSSQLRGPKGSKVKIGILRVGKKEELPFTITRGKIPLNSVDVAYLLAPKLAYIKVSSFGKDTYEEFYDALTDLQNQGAQSLILDLRGNPGGYLHTAIKIADEFLPANKLIVYTQGKSSPKREEFATEGGVFENGKLIVLIDEGSASASEIVAGAVQDWDRAVIVGRRSFGKGLVQEQATLADGSSLRLTIARYYTPTGRCIQKPYKDGIEAYQDELAERFENTDKLADDSSIVPIRGKAFKTPSGKLVYEGGGIEPDISVSFESSAYTAFYAHVVSQGLVNEFAYVLSEKLKKQLSTYQNAEEFVAKFQVGDTNWGDFLTFAAKKGVSADPMEAKKSKARIQNQIKAIIGRQNFRAKGFYLSIGSEDLALQKAIQLLQE